MKVVCPYCNRQAKLVTGLAIYPHRQDLASKKFYICEKDDAYVGTHKGTFKPLGRLANKELRQAKMKAHAIFDPIWKSKRMKRGEAYSWLAKELGIAKQNCHIGMFDVDMCNRVIEVCSNAT